MTLPHPGPTLSAPDLDAALAVLREHGLRVSSARRLVLEALFAAADPLSAERIAGGRTGASPSRTWPRSTATSRRSSAWASCAHFHLGHGPGLYALAGEEREYLVCERCGASARSTGGARRGARLVDDTFGYRPSFKHFPIVGTVRRAAGRTRELRLPLPPAGGTRRRPHRGCSTARRCSWRWRSLSSSGYGTPPTRTTWWRSPRWWRRKTATPAAATRLGAWWGAGHALVLLLIGFPLIFAKSELPAWLESGAEKAVGVVILAARTARDGEVAAGRLPRRRARPFRRATARTSRTAVACATCAAAAATTATPRCEPLGRPSASGCCTAWPERAPWSSC